MRWIAFHACARQTHAATHNRATETINATRVQGRLRKSIAIRVKHQKAIVLAKSSHPSVHVVERQALVVLKQQCSRLTHGNWAADEQE